MQTYLHRWRLNLVTGLVKEERLSETITEFGMINGLHGAVRTATPMRRRVPGRFLFNGLVKHDVVTGAEERFSPPEGVHCSETAMAPPRVARVRTTATQDLHHRHGRGPLTGPGVRCRAGDGRADRPGHAAGAHQ